jgi:hypothetical protein
MLISVTTLISLQAHFPASCLDNHPQQTYKVLRRITQQRFNIQRLGTGSLWMKTG